MLTLPTTDQACAPVEFRRSNSGARTCPKDPTLRAGSLAVTPTSTSRPPSTCRRTPGKGDIPGAPAMTPRPTPATPATNLRPTLAIPAMIPRPIPVTTPPPGALADTEVRTVSLFFLRDAARREIIGRAEIRQTWEGCEAMYISLISAKNILRSFVSACWQHLQNNLNTDGRMHLQIDRQTSS